MLENIYYVYVYLNPLKEGKFEYFENGVGINFDYAPFYIGKGKEGRLEDHLKEATKYLEIENESELENIEHINWHKINTINKIKREGLEPIVYKICENMIEDTAYDLEKFLIKLIGRADKKLGILTNMTDGGDGVKNLNKDRMEIRVKNRRITIENNPIIEEIRVEKFKITWYSDPNIAINNGIKISDAHKKRTDKQKEISNEKRAITIEAKTIEEKENKIIKYKISYNKEKRKKASLQMKKTIINSKINTGTNHNSYILIDYTLLINLYFSFISRKDMIILYNNCKTIAITPAQIRKFYKILNFPMNTTGYRKPLKVKEYYFFIEENKHKINWYIENYERLENEYFLNKHYEKNKDFYDNIK